MWQALLNKLSARTVSLIILVVLLILSTILAYAVRAGRVIELPGGIRIGAAPDLRVRLYINFEGSLDVKDPYVRVQGFQRLLDGNSKPLHLRRGIDAGSMYVDVELEDMDTPVFFEIVKNGSVWHTEDFSLTLARIKAYSITGGGGN